MELGPRHTDLTTKRFSFTIPTLLGIISACSAVIGIYWWAKTTVANLQQSVDISNAAYNDVKSEVKLLREQMYEIAFLYNRNVANENELTHIRRERAMGIDSVVSVREVRRVKPMSVKSDGVKFIPKRDTIDLSKFRRLVR